jgi:hypothetical protein
MAQLKTVGRVFSNKGLNLKKDSSTLAEDEYLELTNLVSRGEGSLSPRPGHQRLIAANNVGAIHTIDRLRTGPLTQRRYHGQNGALLATDGGLPGPGQIMGFIQVASGISDNTKPFPQQRFTSADYSGSTYGTAWKYFATPLQMLKDNGSLSTLQRWGILPPFRPVLTASTGSGTTPPAFSGAETPYTYVATYVNDTVGAESNPSQFMLNGFTANGHGIQLTVYGSPDPQVTAIKIYRAGGSYADGLYRLVVKLANPPGSGSATYIDYAQDSQLLTSDVCQTDNDPPVPSTINFSFKALTISGTIGDQSITADPSALPIGFDVITVGSRVTVFDSTTGQVETAQISGLNSATKVINVYLQSAFTASHGVFVTCNTAAGSPATIALSAFDCIFLAGDPNNPHVLYQSKTAQPEAFGVFQTATQTARAINVGSPSNPIMGLAEFNGGVLVMCREAIFWVSVYNGAMQTPIRYPMTHGLFVKGAWCRVANEIWYLGHDGIYACIGGSEVWKSEPIDSLFKNYPVGNYLPINMTPGIGTTGADIITLEYCKQEVFVNCANSAGVGMRLRHHTAFERWSVEYITDPQHTNLQSPLLLCAQYCEQDLGLMFIAKWFPNQFSSMHLDNQGTSDGWFARPDDGSGIEINCIPADFGAPQVDRLYSDISIECSNPTVGVGVVLSYDYAHDPDPNDNFTIPATVGRIRFPFACQNSQGRQSNIMSAKIFSRTTNILTLYDLVVNYYDLAPYRRGFAQDWDDLGWPNDKFLRSLNLEVDTGGIQATLQLQADGFDIGDPFHITSTNTDRNRLLSVPINKNLIVRMVRFVLVPGPGGYTNYFGHKFEFFQWPGSNIYWESEYTDFGHPFEKYFRTVTLELDTEGSAVSVAIRVDGAVVDSFSVTTNFTNRKQTLAMGYNIIGTMVQVQVQAHSGTTPFRMFGYSFETINFPPALSIWDSDWTNLGHDREKNLRNLVLEIDTQGAPVQVTLRVDGVDVFVVNLTSNINDRNRVFALPDNTVGRTIKLLIQQTVATIPFRLFNWSVDKWDYPADLSFWENEWSDLGYPEQKTLKWLDLEVDTKGVACVVQVQADGPNNVLVGAFQTTVTTTTFDRRRLITLPANQTVRNVRLLLTAGAGGYIRYFSHRFEFNKEPADITSFDTYQFNFGYNGYTFIKQAFLQYYASKPLTIYFLVDKNVLFYKTTLPAQADATQREVSRFYLPARVGEVLNKSKVHRIVVESAAPFRLYQDGSRLEWMAVGNDQRTSYQQQPLNELMGPN